MSYTDKKITQEEINAHHVQGATDHLIGNAQQNKAVFDDLPEFIAGKHNELIDELNSHHGDEIKVAVDEWLAEHPEVTTTVQDNSLTTAKYVDGSVTEPKIAEGAVTPPKLDRAYSTPADLASVNANLTNELNVLDARMDEFASLPEGSTSGNAELVDIRAGADGTTHPTAGDAVRGQVADLKSDLTYLTGFEEEAVTINNGSGTDSLVSKRVLFGNVIPEYATIKDVTIHVASTGGSAVLNIEVWELADDGNTLTRVKKVNPTLTANTDIVANINHKSSKKRYIGLMSYNCNIYQNPNATGKYMLVSYNDTLDTSSLSLSSLTTFNNYCPYGIINYVTVSAEIKEPYKLPVKWRQGIIAGNGTTYTSQYGCITDFLIPTSLCDYIVPLDTTYDINICYFNDVNGRPSFAFRSADSNAKTNINKNYPYFAINIFKSWSVQTTIDLCDDIVELYTSAVSNTADIFTKVYLNRPVLNINDMWSICHQGYNDDTLGRNRKGGYAQASLRGFTHGECDIKLTSDNKVVCCHDDTFVDATSGDTITIANKTLAELQACDYYGTTIATLGEIIEECKRYGLKLFIDQFSMGIVYYACDVISEYNAWDICTLIIAYTNEYPNYASEQVNYIKENYNANANFAILFNSFSNYSYALAYAKTLDNAIFYIGQYTNAQLSTLKTIAKELNGKCKLMVWTVDELNTALYNALPYINGYCSNVWSGNDVFNPTRNNGM